MKTHTRFFLPLVLSSLAFVACSSATESDEPSENPGEAISPIIGGTASDASQNSVVLLTHTTSQTSTSYSYDSCTGILLAPKLVLTAHHCVAPADSSVSCYSDGTPAGGGNVGASYSPSTLYVHTGQTMPANPTTSYNARGAQVLTDGSTNLCNHDIALIVLDTAITNMPISPVRLDSDVKVGESVTAVGWGLTSQGASSLPSVRQERTGLTVLAVGPGSMPPNEFELGESVCSGDSGGPAFSAANAVLGVVSRGGACQGSSARQIYTKLSPFKSLILSGYQLAGAQPWYENNSNPNLSSPDAGTPSTPPASSGTPAVDLQQLCVDTINGYRATRGLPALARWTSAESCVTKAASTDIAKNIPHSTFPECLGGGGGTQSECTGWPMPIDQSITKCLAQMWAGGSAAMTSSKYTKVACGYAASADEKTYWATQDFQ
ncbi:MAG: trypsin-like serine protease [Polyangiaceae bacterium]|nr:trypsin-like serine protease [Polyangiaceae bacterium]